jgi:hypothetical protein
MCGQEWQLVKGGWVNLSFGICERRMQTSCGILALASATHLPTGTSLLAAEELHDCALAAEIAEPLLPDDDDASASEWEDAGDRVQRAWREADLVPSGITDRFGRAIFHLGSNRLLRAIMRRHIEQHERWGGAIPAEVAAAIARRYPALVAGMDRPALVQMLENEFLETITDQVLADLVARELAAVGITDDLIGSKTVELLSQAGGDKDEVAKHFERWLKRKIREVRS